MTPSKPKPRTPPAETAKAPPKAQPEALLKKAQAQVAAESAEREERFVRRLRPCSELQYAVKLVQGIAPKLSDASFIAPGRYFTAINVHNPSTCERVRFRWKVALATLDAGTVSIITPFQDATLRPDEALEIDAVDVARRLNVRPTQFAKGFVVIESPCELDVVAVYTMLPAGGPIEAPSAVAFHTERVPARKIEGCQDLDADISTGVVDWKIIYTSMPSVNIVPCPAVVIPDADTLHNPQWALQPGSKWISARANVNFGPAFAAGFYGFEHCFTLCSAFARPELDMEILVDDQAWIILNGQLITPVFHVPGNLGGPPQQITVTQGFLPGRNCLQVWVLNEFNDHQPNPAGVNVRARLTAERGACPEGCGCGC